MHLPEIQSLDYDDDDTHDYKEEKTAYDKMQISKLTSLDESHEYHHHQKTKEKTS